MSGNYEQYDFGQAKTALGGVGMGRLSPDPLLITNETEIPDIPFSPRQLNKITQRRWQSKNHISEQLCIYSDLKNVDPL